MSDEDQAPRRPGTLAVHGRGEHRTGPLVTPIVQTSTFAFASAAEMRRYLEGDEELFLYTRYANPTLQALEEHLAALEGAESAVVFASGMAAATTGILSLLEPGDEVLAAASLYGGTARFVREVLPGLGFSTRRVPLAALASIGEVASPRSRVLVIETPTNPTCDVVDIAAVSSAAHRAGLAVFVDNTFATPYLQRPLALGADLVMHSLTKALGGHSDLIGGALAGSRERILRAHSLLKVWGGCMDPHTAFLVHRGLRTLHLRVERQCRNASVLARRLSGHPKVARVLHPSLPDHPGHAVARRQMSDFGGVLCLALHGGLLAAERFYDGLRIMTRAASLGGVETLVSLPVHTSHHGQSAEQLAEAGIDPGMVRIAVGVEDEDDLTADAERALARVEA